MTRTLILALGAAAALAGCNKEDHTIVAGGSPDNDVHATANEVQLPPSISASKAYRCKDNHLIYVDWMSDGTARLKKSREEVGTPVAVGSELKGDARAAAITYNGESCKA